MSGGLRRVIAPAVLVLVLASGTARAGEPAFSFVLEEAQGFRVDTRAGTVTKDMIADPDITIRLRFSRSDLRSIERAFRASHLLEVPEPYPDAPPDSNGTTWIVSPSFTWTLDLDMDGQHRHWKWNTARASRTSTQEWDALRSAVRTVRETLDQYMDYRSLPRARGGYL
jgi:hypothetical protein